MRTHGVTFTLMSKVDVNGEHEHPIFTFLKHNTPPMAGEAANLCVW